MRTDEIHRNRNVRDAPPTEGDKFARESNTWRRMRPWQIWTAVAAAAAFIVGGLIVVT